MRSHTVKTDAHKRLRGNPVSPTAPTFVTLNDQLTKAHSRIRELQARETELLADNRTLRAVITELTDDDHPRTAAGLTLSRPTMAVTGSASAITPASTQASASVPRRDHRNPRGTPASAAHPATGTNRVKTRRFPYV